MAIRNKIPAPPEVIDVPDVLAVCADGDGSNPREYPVKVKFAFGHWCVAIQCGMGAWGSWRLADAREFGDDVWIQYPSFRVTNMRAVVAAAVDALNASGKGRI